MDLTFLEHDVAFEVVVEGGFGSEGDFVFGEVV